MSASVFQKQIEQDSRARIELAFRKHHGRFIAVARRIVRSEADAEDVVQQAFLNAFKSAGSFDGRAQITTWLHRIVCNTALMHLRRNKRRPAELYGDLSEVEQMGRCAVTDASDAVLSPRAAAEQEELGQALQGALAHLNETDQAIVCLRLVDGYSTQEVAAHYGLSASAAKTRLHRARAILKDKMAMSVAA